MGILKVKDIHKLKFLMRVIDLMSSKIVLIYQCALFGLGIYCLETVSFFFVFLLSTFEPIHLL